MGSFVQVIKVNWKDAIEGEGMAVAAIALFLEFIDFSFVIRIGIFEKETWDDNLTSDYRDAIVY